MLESAVIATPANWGNKTELWPFPSAILLCFWYVFMYFTTTFFLSGVRNELTNWLTSLLTKYDFPIPSNLTS